MFNEKGERGAIQVIKAFVRRCREYGEWDFCNPRGSVDYMDIDSRFGVRNVQPWGRRNGGWHD